MRIIGGHDYYDNAMAFGQDARTVFVREKDRVIEGRDFVGNLRAGIRPLSFRSTGAKYRRPYRVGLPHMVDGLEFTYTQRVVVFCGRVFHGIEIRKTLTNDDAVVHWQRETFDKWMVSQRIEVVVDDWLNGKINIDAEFSSYPASAAMHNWLVENKIAIAIRATSHNRRDKWGRIRRDIDAWEWKINSDGLNAVQFYRVMNAYNAFQELAMFVGGVMPASANPMVPIADSVRLEKHGFDRVTSFRHRK